MIFKVGCLGGRKQTDRGWGSDIGPKDNRPENIENPHNRFLTAAPQFAVMMAMLERVAVIGCASTKRFIASIT